MNAQRHRVLIVAGAVAIALAGFWIGRRTAGHGTAVSGQERLKHGVAAPVTTRIIERQVAGGARSDDELIDEVRAAVRSELAAASREPNEAPPADDAEDPARAAIEEHANEILDGAVNRGRLDAASQHELHMAIQKLGRAQQEALLSRLHMAINEQRLDLENP